VHPCDDPVNVGGRLKIASKAPSKPHGLVSLRNLGRFRRVLIAIRRSFSEDLAKNDRQFQPSGRQSRCAVIMGPVQARSSDATRGSTGLGGGPGRVHAGARAPVSVCGPVSGGRFRNSAWFINARRGVAAFRRRVGKAIGARRCPALVWERSARFGRLRTIWMCASVLRLRLPELPCRTRGDECSGHSSAPTTIGTTTFSVNSAVSQLHVLRETVET
jgi:hypothetical protein